MTQNLPRRRLQAVLGVLSLDSRFVRAEVMTSKAARESGLRSIAPSGSFSSPRCSRVCAPQRAPSPGLRRGCECTRSHPAAPGARILVAVPADKASALAARGDGNGACVPLATPLAQAPPGHVGWLIRSITHLRRYCIHDLRRCRRLSQRERREALESGKPSKHAIERPEGVGKAITDTLLATADTTNV